MIVTKPKTLTLYFENEQWADVIGYEGLYQVSSVGRVRSCDRTVQSCPKVGFRIAKGRVMKSSLNGYGYLTVGLWKDGKCSTIRVHSLVARAFLGECPKSFDVNHKDGIKTNNCVSNLEYCTRSANIKHAYTVGLRGKKMNTLKPLLKWCGGKTWLAPKLAEMFEPYKHTHTWVSPFCGALGDVLGVMPEKAILSDVNPHLINLYREIQQDLQSPSGWENSKEMFDHVKQTFNRSLEENSSIQAGNWWKAKAFYYLNRTCYNGLCRFNLKGEFNTSYGNFKKPILNHDFSVYKEVFKCWDFFTLGYGDSLSIIKDRVFDNHFVYADPPYDAGFTGYSGSFSWNDQVNLAEMLASLNCPVVASNKETDRTVDLYKGLGFDIQIIEAPRRISCNGDRTAVREILVSKNI